MYVWGTGASACSGSSLQMEPFGECGGAGDECGTGKWSTTFSRLISERLDPERGTQPVEPKMVRATPRWHRRFLLCSLQESPDGALQQRPEVGVPPPLLLALHPSMLLGTVVLGALNHGW